MRPKRVTEDEILSYLSDGFEIDGFSDDSDLIEESCNRNNVFKIISCVLYKSVVIKKI